MTLACMTMPSPVGDLTLVASDEGLMAVLWPDDDPARVRLGARSEATDHPVLRETASQLSEYFAGQRRHFCVPLHFKGTDFQRQVWAQLRTIPAGQTISYRELAQRVGRPAAVRAAGAANGANPVGIVIPCHRVIGANAALTGYGGGLHRKQWLLAHEAAWRSAQPSSLSSSTRSALSTSS